MFFAENTSNTEKHEKSYSFTQKKRKNGICAQR